MQCKRRRGQRRPEVALGNRSSNKSTIKIFATVQRSTSSVCSGDFAGTRRFEQQGYHGVALFGTATFLNPRLTVDADYKVYGLASPLFGHALTPTPPLKSKRLEPQSHAGTASHNYTLREHTAK